MKSAIDRFKEKYIPDSDTDCWNWTGARNGNGRAAISVDGKSILAHRFAYEQYVDVIGDDEEIRRTCSNPICVNPAHLYVFHKDAEQRFWDLVDISEEGHWYWIGNGPYKYNGTSYSPRNKAYEYYFKQEEPPGRLFSLCGVDDCISPVHTGDQNALFFSKVDKNSSGHWYWTGRLLKSGYAHVSRNGKNVYVHRVSWELAGNQTDPKKLLFHKCGIKHCVNPDHLELITYSQMCQRRKPRRK